MMTVRKNPMLDSRNGLAVPLLGGLLSLIVIVTSPDAQEASFSASDCDQLRSQVQAYGWRVERTLDGAVTLLPPVAQRLGAMPSTQVMANAENAPVPSGQPLGFDALRAVLNGHGWQVERDSDQSLLIFRAGPEAGSSGSQSPPTVLTSELQALAESLAGTGWRLSSSEDGALILQPVVPASPEEAVPSVGRLPSKLAAKRVQVKPFLVGELHRVERPVEEIDTASRESAGPALEAGPALSMDTDADGVTDREDLCPETLAGVVVNQLGCARAAPVELRGVSFRFGSADLTENAKSILDRQAQILRNIPHLRLRIIGHTDSLGSAEVNQQLSERRAAAVREYLITQGIAPSALVSEGRGEGEPIADNGSRAGRARNRRVELLPLGGGEE